MISVASRSFLFPTPRRKLDSAAQDRQLLDDKREARLARQEEELREREAALRERERQVHARERRMDADDQSFPAPREGSANNSLRDPSGATAPGDVPRSATAQFIIKAHETATTGKTVGDALPTDKTARLIVECATGKMLEPAAIKPNSAADAILRADRWRRGEEPLE